MDIDVSGVRAQNALMGTKCCIDERGIGLGTPYQEMNIQVIILTLLTDPRSCLLTVFILSVAHRLLQIGGCQAL